MIPSSATHHKPYKFLDHYGFEDRDIFFGRDLESEILLSDVIATRLVVLFAKTGSGKSSLINAGVRPRLEDLDYLTFYIRVEKDPITSLQKVLRDNKLPMLDPQLPLDVQLEHIVLQKQKPIVLFFDQFEEFFIFVAQDQPHIAKQFVSDVARLYRNRDSGVHIVFSMREEYFVEMDIFRDEIPSIFHNDSSLRLRWFDIEQARDVITKPAQRYDVQVEDALVERLIQDLQQGDRVEPAKLQIVCDTLWQQRSDTGIKLTDYERLGGAERILDRRLLQDVTVNFDDENLRHLEKLMPELTTDRKTKSVRGFEELAKNLQWDSGLLEEMVKHLSELGVMRVITQSGTRFIEWTSDYVAERTPLLKNRVRTVLLMRQLQSSIDKAHRLAEDLGQIEAGRLTYEQRDELYLSDDFFELFSADIQYLRDLEKKQVEFLFLASLEHGGHMSLWFEQAAAKGVPVWDIIKDRITNKSARDEQARNTVRLLSELKGERVMEMLARALENDRLSDLTVTELGRMNTSPAFQLLEIALKQDALAPLALPEIARSGNPQTVDLLQAALKRPNLAQQAELELDRISRGKPSPTVDHAKQVLEWWEAERQKQPYLITYNNYGKLGGLDDRDWESLLRYIHEKKCTVFIGPGTTAEVLPTESDIAREWAEKYAYPFEDTHNLARVSQFMAVDQDDMFPKERIQRQFRSVSPPDFSKPNEPHALLADLNLPIYITTNYDSFMSLALKSRGRDPKRELCRWNRFMKMEEASVFKSGYAPTRASPLVYHLYGHYDLPQSLVLTEDDYLDFLVHLWSEPALLPPAIRTALAGTSLLFIGYNATDQRFKALLRSLIGSLGATLGYTGVLVQHDRYSAHTKEIDYRQKQYIEDYSGRSLKIKLRIYWGDLKEFSLELRQRWDKFRQSMEI